MALKPRIWSCSGRMCLDSRYMRDKCVIIAFKPVNMKAMVDPPGDYSGRSWTLLPRTVCSSQFITLHSANEQHPL
jgi:hypothetical protein